MSDNPSVLKVSDNPACKAGFAYASMAGCVEIALCHCVMGGMGPAYNLCNEILSFGMAFA